VNRIEFILLIAVAFLPPLIYAIWIRNTEKINRERWVPIFFCFLWGASIAIVASIILELILGTIAISYFDASRIDFLLVVFIAPFAEELTKPLALRSRIVKRELDELEDGLIFGAVAGLGFSATENLFYGYDAFISQGLLFFLVLIAIRSFGGCLLHAAATAWTGYGVGRSVMKKTSLLGVIPFFILACFVHAFYNFLVTFEMNGVIIGFIAAISFVALSIHIVRKKIKTLDMLSR